MAAPQASVVDQAVLIGSWHCRVESIKPQVQARMNWTLEFSSDGQYTSAGSTRMDAMQVSYPIIHQFNIQGSWSVADGALHLSAEKAELANATQPADMNLEDTAALRQAIDTELDIDTWREKLLEPSSSRILELSRIRLALLDAPSQDVFECRPSAETEEPQAR